MDAKAFQLLLDRVATDDLRVLLGEFTGYAAAWVAMASGMDDDQQRRLASRLLARLLVCSCDRGTN